MKWNEIKKQSDVDYLMKEFRDFHDSCIREAHIWTATWVNQDLSMSISPELDVNMRLHIQRQYTDPIAIELFFEELTRFNLVPAPENCDAIIITTTMIFRNGLIYWATVGNWDPEKIDCNDYTWISAKKLKWRGIDNWIGPTLQYGLKETNGNT